MQYLTFETETDTSDEDHTVKSEEEEAARKLLAGIVDEDNVIENKKAAKHHRICSCGFFTCGAIRIYGHPVPVFKESIEPLFPQSRRDRKALELKK